MLKPNKSRHYVDNVKFYEAIKDYVHAYNKAEEEGTDLPPVTNYIGSCVVLICQRLSLVRSFINYSYRDEMISDGIENIMTYLHKFNPDEYNNPFAYYTQIAYFAFIRRIQSEEKQQYIKHKFLSNASVMNNLVTMPDDDLSHFHSIYVEMGSDSSDAVVTKFESKIKEKRLKAKKARDIEKFLKKEEDDAK